MTKHAKNAVGDQIAENVLIEEYPILEEDWLKTTYIDYDYIDIENVLWK